MRPLGFDELQTPVNGATNAIRKLWIVWFMTSRFVAQGVSYTTTVCAHKIKDLPVAHGCRAAAGLPPPSPLDDRRAMVSWERLAQSEQETSTWGCVAWSLAVGAGDRAKPVMDAYIYEGSRYFAKQPTCGRLA